MSTLLKPSPNVLQAALPEDWPSGIVVATDGRTQGDAALAAASTLAGSFSFGVISVVSSRNSTDRSPAWTDLPDASISRRELVEAQLRRVLGESVDAPIELRSGYVPAVLASFAEMNVASLLVVGIGRPHVLDRLRGDESTIRLSRLLQTPMLAVAAGKAVPPARVVVAMDFTATSVRAARLALAICAPEAKVFLVHVTSPDMRRSPPGALRRHADALQSGFCGRVTPIELMGDAATEILSFANAQAADAIAIGTRGHHELPRGSIGPVATRVIRCSSCSLLVAPATPSTSSR